MARIIYNDTASFSTPNLSLSIDSVTGFLSSTYSGSMSSFVGNVGSYSTGTTFSNNQNNILINANATYNLPTSPPNGMVITLRSTTTTNPTINGGANPIRNVGSASGVTTFQMIANGTYMFAYYNGVWYGI